MRKIQEQIPKDPELAALKEVVLNGWPNTIKKLPPVLRPYWNYREELSIKDSLIMKRHRIIIPQVLQGDILAKLHASHQGAENTKFRARTSVFWKDLNKDIEDRYDQILQGVPRTQAQRTTRAPIANRTSTQTMADHRN